MRTPALCLLFAQVLAAEPAFRLEHDPAKLLSPAITEASGIAASPSAEGFLWVVNDSGGTTAIHLIATDGTARGSVTVEGVKNTDWEDLAGFTEGGKPYLLIADTGDNASSRKTRTLHVVREPEPPAEGMTLSGSIPVAWSIEFAYEDGPRDCEAVAVDATTSKIILVSKRTDPPGVYELPLRPGKDPVARRIGVTSTQAPPTALPIPFMHQPTGLDISRDGRLAAAVTYHGVHLFRRNAKESWADAFARKPEFLGAHGLPQAEAVAFSRDGRTIYAVSEKANSPIARYGAGD